jgi:hypothetical protein
MYPFILPQPVPEQSDKKNSFLKELIIDLNDSELDLINLNADKAINYINENIISILEKLYKSDKNRKFNKIELENILQYLKTNNLSEAKNKDFTERFLDFNHESFPFLDDNLEFLDDNLEYFLVALNILLEKK